MKEKLRHLEAGRLRVLHDLEGCRNQLLHRHPERQEQVDDPKRLHDSGNVVQINALPRFNLELAKRLTCYAQVTQLRITGGK